MKRLVLALTLLLLTTSLYAQKKTASVKIINQSKWEIHHIFMSSTEDDSWGPDQLGEKVLAKGDSLTVSGIECDLYDIKVVDEDGDECVIEEIDLCEDSFWKITDKELLECEGFRD